MSALTLIQVLTTISVLSLTAEAALRLYAVRADAREHVKYLARIMLRDWCAGCRRIRLPAEMGWNSLYFYRCTDCRKERP